MAGRGGGRRIFNVDSVCFPSTLLQPSPVFPVMEMKPLPLPGGEEVEYLLALKQDLRGTMRTLPYYITAAVTHTDVERYSDKYHNSENRDLLDWHTDWRRVPRELRRSFRKPIRLGVSVKEQCKEEQDKEEVLLKLENLEKKEKDQSSEEEEEGGGAKEEQEEEPEEELEEETDYGMSYFENGEEFGGDSDDNMDEAVY